MVNARSTAARDEVLLTAQEAAEFLSVPPTWVLAEARSGRLPHLRLGRYVRFQRGMLEAWLLEHAHGPSVGTRA